MTPVLFKVTIYSPLAKFTDTTTLDATDGDDAAERPLPRALTNAGTSEV
jgi:hypothetical protein